jgi:hypothetical protein
MGESNIFIFRLVKLIMLSVADASVELPSTRLDYQIEQTVDYIRGLVASDDVADVTAVRLTALVDIMLEIERINGFLSYKVCSC